MDANNFGLLATFFLSLAAGAAMVIWPQPGAVAKFIFVTSVLGLIACCVWYASSNYVNRVKLLPILAMIAGAVLIIGGAIKFYEAPTPSIRSTNNPPSPPASPPQSIAPTVPSLFSLFMNDLQPARGVKWMAFTDFELTDPDSKVRIFYNVFDDFNANAKYLSFYIPAIFFRTGPPPPSQTLSIAQYIAEHYQQYISDIQAKRWVEMKTLGDASADTTKTVQFSGRVYVYHADNLDVEQLAALTKSFRGNGANAQFRGMEYAIAVGTSIQLGNAKPPPRYEMHDNMPQLVPNASTNSP